MLIEYNPDEYKTVMVQETCDYHKKHPGANWAGCTCFGSISQVKKTKKELAVEDCQRLREKFSKMHSMTEEEILDLPRLKPEGY